MDISFYHGETWSIECAFHEGETVPLDLTGAGVEFGIYRADGTQVVLLTLGDGIEVQDAAQGRALVTVSPARQASFHPYERYAYEARVTTSVGAVSVQAQGAWIILPSLFRD